MSLLNLTASLSLMDSLTHLMTAPHFPPTRRLQTCRASGCAAETLGRLRECTVQTGISGISQDFRLKLYFGKVALKTKLHLKTTLSLTLFCFIPWPSIYAPYHPISHNNSHTPESNQEEAISPSEGEIAFVARSVHIYPALETKFS